MLILSQLAQLMPHAPPARLGDCLPALDEAMRTHGIVSLRRAAAFLAQLAHESGEFRFMEERWGPTAAQQRYEPQSDLARRLGNTQPGDGQRYKGRGPIQITGRANYQRYGDLVGQDLVGRPELAATPAIGFATAALFWQKNGLNELADAGDFTAITQRINGGQNGAAERERYFALAQQVLKGAFPPAAPATTGRRRAGPAEELPRGAEAVRGDAPSRAAASGATGH